MSALDKFKLNVEFMEICIFYNLQNMISYAKYEFTATPKTMVH